MFPCHKFYCCYITFIIKNYKGNMNGDTAHTSPVSSAQFNRQSCPTLCDPMNCSKPGFPVHHQLPEFTILPLQSTYFSVFCLEQGSKHSCAPHPGLCVRAGKPLQPGCRAEVDRRYSMRSSSDPGLGLLLHFQRILSFVCFSDQF